MQWKPQATYALLIAMAAMWLLQNVVARMWGELPYIWIFLIGTDWYARPWTLVTSTMAHSLAGLSHLFFNGLMLYFFGPPLERIMGAKRFLIWFFVAGALAGVFQVALSGGLALGASGAIMFVFGALVMIMPRHTVLVWGLIPAPFWALGLFYAVLDLLGAIGPANGIGNFAHLSGMAIGLALGYRIKRANAWHTGR